MYIFQFLQNPFQVAVFLFSILIAISIHEYAHAAVAVFFGDDTPKLMGRTTINPLAHIDIFGAIFFLLVGFGWGKPVIINPIRLPKRVYELYVALAGPLSNLLLALAINLSALYIFKSFLPTALISAFQLLASINVALAAFNILPIPPLDGSSILAYFFPNWHGALASQVGLIILLALLILPSNLLSAIMTPIIYFFNLITLGG